MARWRPQWWQIRRGVVKVWISGGDSPRITGPGQAATVNDVVSDGARDPRAQRVTAALADATVGPVSWVVETGSTNADLMAAAAAGAPHGSVLATDHQTAGRGRRDRRWESAPGDALMFSILLSPPGGVEGLASTTTALGVAAAEACRALGAEGVALKWPNDLVVGEAGTHRKLAGILAQSVVSADQVAAVVGMGLNVRGARLGDLAPAAVALDELVADPDRERLLTDILQRLSETLALSPAELRIRYLALSATVGTVVEVTTDDGLVVGEAIDVIDGGALLVDSEDGLHEVVVGDVVSVRPGRSG